jgi:hypothetical protein
VEKPLDAFEQAVENGKTIKDKIRLMYQEKFTPALIKRDEEFANEIIHAASFVGKNTDFYESSNTDALKTGFELAPEDFSVSKNKKIGVFSVAEEKMFPARRKRTGWELGLRNYDDRDNHNHNNDHNSNNNNTNNTIIHNNNNHNNHNTNQLGKQPGVGENQPLPLPGSLPSSAVPVSTTTGNNINNNINPVKKIFASATTGQTMKSPTQNNNNNINNKNKKKKPEFSLMNINLTELKKAQYATRKLPELTAEIADRYFDKKSVEQFNRSYQQLQNQGAILAGGYEELHEMVKEGAEENILNFAKNSLLAEGILSPRSSNPNNPSKNNRARPHSSHAVLQQRQEDQQRLASTQLGVKIIDEISLLDSSSSPTNNNKNKNSNNNQKKSGGWTKGEEKSHLQPLQLIIGSRDDQEEEEEENTNNKNNYDNEIEEREEQEEYDDPLLPRSRSRPSVAVLNNNRTLALALPLALPLPSSGQQPQRRPSSASGTMMTKPKNNKLFLNNNNPNNPNPNQRRKETLTRPMARPSTATPLTRLDRELNDRLSLLDKEEDEEQGQERGGRDHRGSERDKDRDREGEPATYNPASPRAIFLAGCLKHGLPPRAHVLLRKRISSSINLAHIGIGNKMAMVLAEALPTLPYLQAINLNDNNLEDDGLSAIITAIAAHPNVEIVDISQNIIGSEAAAALAAFV